MPVFQYQPITAMQDGMFLQVIYAMGIRTRAVDLDSLNVERAARGQAALSESDVVAWYNANMVPELNAAVIESACARVDKRFDAVNYANIRITTAAGADLVAQADAQSQLNIKHAADEFQWLDDACKAAGLPQAAWIDAMNNPVPVTAADMQALYKAGFDRKVALALASNVAKAAIRAVQSVPPAACALLGITEAAEIA